MESGLKSKIVGKLINGGKYGWFWTVSACGVRGETEQYCGGVKGTVGNINEEGSRAAPGTFTANITPLAASKWSWRYSCIYIPLPASLSLWLYVQASAD